MKGPFESTGSLGCHECEIDKEFRCNDKDKTCFWRILESSKIFPDVSAAQYPKYISDQANTLLTSQIFLNSLEVTLVDIFQKADYIPMWLYYNDGNYNPPCDVPTYVSLMNKKIENTDVLLSRHEINFVLTVINTIQNNLQNKREIILSSVCSSYNIRNPGSNIIHILVNNENNRFQLLK
jgi:hypothetical protein